MPSDETLYQLAQEARSWAREADTPYAISNLLTKLSDLLLELTPVRTYYRSTRDGKLWCESRSSAEVLERTILEGGTIVYETAENYEIWSGWFPWEPNAEDLAEAQEGALELKRMQEED